MNDCVITIKYPTKRSKLFEKMSRKPSEHGCRAKRGRARLRVKRRFGSLGQNDRSFRRQFTKQVIYAKHLVKIKHGATPRVIHNLKVLFINFLNYNKDKGRINIKHILDYDNSKLDRGNY